MDTRITMSLYRTIMTALLLWLTAIPVVSAMPAIQHWVTDNGARVYFVPAPELPMVDINVTFAAGGVRDDGHAGLAHMTSTLLDMGAAGLSADEIARRIESLGAELSTGSARDMAWIKLRSLSDGAHLPPALKLLADVINRPDFNKQDFERERKRTIHMGRGPAVPWTASVPCSLSSSRHSTSSITSHVMRCFPLLVTSTGPRLNGWPCR